MSYLRAGGSSGISLELLELLAQLVRMPLVPEDAEALAAALRNQLEAVELIDRLELEDVQPSLWFDPRWE
jgi:Asp-tRNA(Asn)/Glu-tRNA(Gln) amidotransferase C subunit